MTTIISGSIMAVTLLMTRGVPRVELADFVEHLAELAGLLAGADHLHDARGSSGLCWRGALIFLPCLTAA
jgi:hypothetical protein